MYSFCSDYSEGACPEIMQALIASNMLQTNGYGEDVYCEQAKQALYNVLGQNTCDIHFLVGGTQANLTVISSALRPYEAVIAAASGHINVHETGAIEATGHKVLIAQSKDGKLYANSIQKIMEEHVDEHMVKPAMVYISNATELGTIYYKEELQALHQVCKKHGLFLFMDGARLGSAMSAKDNDITFMDICTYCDVFYIGGTKNGALFGEAVVIVNEKLKKDFRYMIKQRGGLLAKGRLLGIQFLTLFEKGLFISLATQANQLAMQMQEAIAACGYHFFIKTTTNQVFPILPHTLLKELEKEYAFQVWTQVDEQHSAIRLVTSWATTQKYVTQFIHDVNAIQVRISKSIEQ